VGFCWDGLDPTVMGFGKEAELVYVVPNKASSSEDFSNLK
jgi:hypothetical protein